MKHTKKPTRRPDEKMIFGSETSTSECDGHVGKLFDAYAPAVVATTFERALSGNDDLLALCFKTVMLRSLPRTEADRKRASLQIVPEYAVFEGEEPFADSAKEFEEQTGMKIQALPSPAASKKKA
jgi:hypothetical protein